MTPIFNRFGSSRAFALLVCATSAPLARSGQREGMGMQAEVKGTAMPILQVALEQGEELVSTHGELAWMTPSIQMSQTAGSCRDSSA